MSTNMCCERGVHYFRGCVWVCTRLEDSMLDMAQRDQVQPVIIAWSGVQTSPHGHNRKHNVQPATLHVTMTSRTRLGRLLPHSFRAGGRALQ